MITRTDLSAGWTLRLADGAVPADVPSHVISALPIPATVPGTVHTDLLAASLIPDPYIDRSEITLDWIGRTAWQYERTLEHSAIEGERVLLAFEGLDTIATVTVNDVVVGRSENMHRRYEFDATDALIPGDNTLAVRFDSVWEFAEGERTRLGTLPNAYPAPFNFVRKMACNFGWDWGPTLVTAGIWRDVTLVRAVEPRIARVSPVVTVEGPRGRARFEVDLAGAAGEDLVLVASIGDSIAEVHLSADARSAVVEVVIDDPELWWPHGLGAQKLYPVDIELRTGTTVADSWSDRIGFRSLRLDTEPDSAGTPFVFVVNDATIPIRGANWIPDDCFLPRVTEQRLRERLGQAVDSNTNLLRIWGGGVYESDTFYRLCDELGILVWQDFLFACAAYPEDERLAREVEAEARDNVQRLMQHPSLVLWNGNNENIWGWFDWDWQGQLGDKSWGLGYYLDILPRAVAETDPARPYWAGSPYSGTMDIHPNHDDHALKHIWDVWNEVDYTVYRDYRPRFVSEFGWQAPPTWSTLKASVRDDPLTPTSPGMLHHQKANDGNGKLERGIAAHFEVPTGMADWHYAMQLNQARAIEFGIEHFRSLRPHNFGSIVWQLNDCWPVTSWAAVDGYGRKKPMWYSMRAAQATRLLTLQPRGEGLAVIGVNDGGETWREPMTVSRIGFDGAVKAHFDARMVVDRFGATTLALPTDVAVAEDPRSELIVARTAGGVQALWFFAEDRDLDYPDADFTTEVRRDGADALLTVTANTLLRDLCLFPDRIDAAAEADDSVVTLLPGERRTFRIRNLPPGEDEKLGGHPVLRTADELVVSGDARTVNV